MLSDKSVTSIESFYSMVDAQIQKFPDSRLLRRVNDGTVTLIHYQTILATLFHQTYSSPYTFAKAAVRCSWHHEQAKEYLLRHAEEERTHWRWVLQDLAAVGYAGADLRHEPPHPTSQAYIGLNHLVAEEHPVARLAIAAVLEGIGAAHGAVYGRKLLEQLALKPEQASFFLSHAETDKTHTVELREVIQACDLSSGEWKWMEYSARTAGQFYRAMYDHEGYA
jgi:hypothetical protein